MRKKINNIIWDFNGTLLNDVSICLKSINSLLSSRNLPILNKAKYLELFTFPVIDYYKAIGFNFSHEDFEMPAMEFIDNYRAHLPEAKLFHGINSLLTLINKAGKKQSILSAMEEPFLKKTLVNLNINQFFDEIAGIQDHFAHGKVERGKQLIMSQKFNPLETLLIGDTLHDYEVAKALGINCLLVSYGHYSGNRLIVNGQPVVHSITEIQTYLGL